jgi:hypothetical protein
MGSKKLIRKGFGKPSPNHIMSTAHSITLNDVPVPLDESGQTHIIIYREKRSTETQEMQQQIERLTTEVERLSNKISQLELGSTPFFGAEVAPAPCGIDIWRMSGPGETNLGDVEELPATKSMFQVLINKLPSLATPDASEAEEEAEAECKAEEEEEAVAEAEEEEEEEEEALELEEFEYKGVTYYKDPDGQVYQKDDDGDLDDTPIGVWNEAKQKIQKYAKAA